MKPGAHEELEEILQESLKLLGETDWDLGQLQQWGARREETYARLRGGELARGDEERTATHDLIEELLEIDAIILARLQDQCCDLSRKINDAARFRRSYARTSSHAPSLIQRAV